MIVDKSRAVAAHANAKPCAHCGGDLSPIGDRQYPAMRCLPCGRAADERMRRRARESNRVIAANRGRGDNGGRNGANA